MTVVAHVPNLFDRSRFRGKVVFVDTAEEARNHNPSLLIVDLDRCEDARGFRLEGTLRSVHAGRCGVGLDRIDEHIFGLLPAALTDRANR